MTARIKCSIYARPSRENVDKQQPESESIQNQKSLLTHYAIDHGWDIYSIFCDDGVTGTPLILYDFVKMRHSSQVQMGDAFL